MSRGFWGSKTWNLHFGTEEMGTVEIVSTLPVLRLVV